MRKPFTRHLFFLLVFLGGEQFVFAADFVWLAGGGLKSPDPVTLCSRIARDWPHVILEYPDQDPSKELQCKYTIKNSFGQETNRFDSMSLRGAGCTLPKIWDEQTLSCRILPPPEPGLIPAKNEGDPNDDLSCNAPNKAGGNPINLTMGNKFQAEEDYRRVGVFPLSFVRYYNSLDGFWRHTYSVRLKISDSLLTLVRADGRQSKFNRNLDVATPELTELGQLVRNGTGWRYISPSQEQYEFDSQGRLLRWRHRNGQFHQLSYSNTSITVVDIDGNSLSFTQDAYYQPLTLNVAGLTVVYQYDTQAKLRSLTKTRTGSSAVRNYHYGDSRFPYALTGITDESAIRYATWAYDDKGRAISSEHAGGAEKVLISYNADGSSTVTNELGKQTTYRFQVIQGVKRITAIEGEPSANCPNSNATFTYDTRGLLKTKTDNKGNLTTFDYNTRGLEVSRTEASGTAQARTITTEWHPTLFLPVTVTEPAHITRYTYDAQGRQLSQAVTPR